MENERAQEYVYHRRLTERDAEVIKYRHAKVKMYADLWRSLGPEAKSRINTSKYYERIEESRDPLLLLKVCHKKLRHYSQESEDITKRLMSKKHLFNIRQGMSETTYDYYERFMRDVEEYEEQNDKLDDVEKSALFTNSLHPSRYGQMLTNISNQTVKRCKTMAKAYSQALKWKMNSSETGNRNDRNPAGILASNYAVIPNNKDKKSDTKPPQRKHTNVQMRRERYR